MRIKPTSKPSGILVELAPGENQIPAPLASPFVFKLQKILVPVDFSDCSRKAVEYAVPFATQFGAELVLLHVVEPYAIVPEMTPYDFESIHDSRGELEMLSKSITRTIHTTGLLCTGTPHLEITAAARALPADLIIISTHGRNAISRRIFGSTAERVVRYAPCPVLVVRECERECVSTTEKPPESK